jgi:thioredoxin-like negative regulator of GroEL
VIRHLLIAIAVAAGAGALSLLLIPGGEEVALMYFKDREFEQAERAYRLELSRRGLQRQLVVPLNELRLQAGRIDEVIGLMSRFAEDNPADADALDVLAEYYRQAQRPHDQVRTLARLAQLRPDPRLLRELAGWYDILEQHAELRAVLRRLADAGQATPAEHEMLALLQAGAGERSHAAATLAESWRSQAAAFQPSALLLYAALLADSDEPDAVRTLAQQWHARGRDPAVLLEVARTLEDRDHTVLALAVLDTLPAALREGGDALLLSSGLQTRLGQGATAVQSLLQRERTRPLSPRLQIQLIDAALASGDITLALERAMRLPGERLPHWMLPALIEAALGAQRPRDARRLFEGLDERTLAARPLFAARTALALGEHDAARRWAAIAEAAASDDQARAALALVYRALGEDARARALLVSLSLENLAAELRTDIVHLYLALGEAQRGLAQLESAGDRHSDGWALLSTAVGREDTVLAWLPGTAAAQADEALLADLYSLAQSRGLARLELALAQRGARQIATPEWRLRLAQTLFAQHQPLPSLELLRELRTQVADAEALYPQALLAAPVHEPALQGELDAYLDERIARDGITAPATEQLVYDVLAAGAPRSALPVLAALARSDAERWFESYAETLEQLDERAALRDAIAQRLDDPALEREQRQWLLLRLARAGDVDGALAQFEQQTLADHGTQQSWLYAYEDAAQQFGAQARLLAFLQRAAFDRAAPRHAREARSWVLLARLDPQQSLPVLARLAAQTPATWDARYRDVLLSLGRRDELARHLLAQARGAPPAARRELAFALLDMGRKNAAVAIFETLASTAAPDADDVRQLLFLWGPRPGATAQDWLAARVRDSSGAARAGWARHLIAVGAAPRAAALLADDAQRGGDRDTAQVYLEALIGSGDRDAVRAQLDTLLAGAADPAALRRIAQLAIEHDHPAAAHAAWQRIVAQAPDDAEALRALGMVSYEQGQWRSAADHLAHYLRTGKDDYEAHYFLAEALTALDQRARAAPHFAAAVRLVDARNAADFRMRSVRAQSLHRLGHTRAAASAYEQLLAERPATGHLRADYGDLLLDSGCVERAASVLR